MSMDNKKIDILFFERPFEDLKRYAFKITRFLKEIDGDLSLACVSLEWKNDYAETNMDFHFFREEIEDIDTFLQTHQIQVIVFTNPRIPDMEMILHAHKLGIKTIMIQEGVIFEGATINEVSLANIIASLHFFTKAISYFKIMFDMCQYAKMSYVGLLREIVRKKKNITSIVAHYFKPYLIGDYVLTMGEHWSSYYINTMGYAEENIKIMGDHDLDGFKVHDKCESAICYVATVLVEDGTRTKAEFDVFINALAKVVDKKTKLYIKLHPRSDRKLYDALNGHNVEFIRQGELPSTNIYIGHRSTLLARALYESDNLIIWRFPNEKADFFEQFATHIVSTEKELKCALDNMCINSRTNNKRHDMERVYWLNPNGAIKTAALMVHQYMKDGYIK